MTDSIEPGEGRLEQLREQAEERRAKLRATREKDEAAALEALAAAPDTAELVDTAGGWFVLDLPEDKYVDRWRSQSTRAEGNVEAATHAAIALAQRCVVYPPEAERRRRFSERRALVVSIANKCVEMVGAAGVRDAGKSASG